MKKSTPLLTMFKGKIHRATVTAADLQYEGSITIDADLLEASGILPGEQVDVVNITNGNRLTTYTIAGAPGEIQINGAAAHLTNVDDMVIIIAYHQLTEDAARAFKPKAVLVDENNRAVSHQPTSVENSDAQFVAMNR